MEELKKYSCDKILLNDAEIYIIKKECYNDIKNDTGFWEKLKITDSLKKQIDMMIMYAEKNDKINVLFAVAYRKNYHLQYEPINLVEYENVFYPVNIRNNWLCRECGYSMEGTVIVPNYEVGGINGYPKIFKKVPCKKCGRLLQNCLIEIY